ncbi:hypothetical protein [Kineococcus sp. R86509]|uniref:hypothetical protein n=1 Tax=Kineococcus sp. R86509 TaxID=3093851 RepID=UPI0036D2EE29
MTHERDGEHEGPAGDEEDEAGRLPLGWVSWLLVLVAVLPPVVLAEVSRRFLTGSADASYFGAYVSEADVRARLDFTFTVRFRLLWASVPVPDVLIAALPVVLGLAAVVVAGRPEWLVPPRWGARVVAGAAGLSALESLVCLVMLVELADEPRSSAYGNLQLSYLLPSTGDFPEIAPVMALLVVMTVVPAVAALVLWQAPGAARVAAEPAAEPDAEPAPEPVAEPPAEPRPEPPVEERPSEVPRLSGAELDAYRRPR